MTSPAASPHLFSHLVTANPPPAPLPNPVLSMPTVTSVAPRAALGPAATAAVQALPTTTAPQFVAPLHPAPSSPGQTFGLILTIKADDIRIQAQGAVEKGSNGRVYRGLWGQEKVALKRLAIYFTDEEGEHEFEYEDGDEGLQWEVSRMASVSHPNVVQFHGLCRKDEKTYMVMEWCDQGDLQDALDKGGLDHARLWQWMLEISAGLAHLHGQGILHRDLKSENVLIDAHGRAKLADLGLAQVDVLLEKKEIAAVNGGLQTPGIMAPEISRMGEGRYNSKPTDLYALGLLFWRMVNPGAAGPSLQQLALGTNEYMVFPDHCPPAFKALILSCCHAKPQQRATIEAVQQQLQRMGPQLHPDHALIGLLEHLTQAMHDTREAVRHYVPSQVTARRVEASMDQYWKIWEERTPDAAFSSPISSTQTASGVMNTASSSTTTTTSTAQPASTLASTAIDFAARSIVLANPPLRLQDRFDTFLAAPGSTTLLLLGDAGLGKTLSTHVLAEQLLQQWWRHIADPASHPRPAHFPIVLRTHVADWSEGALKAAYAGIVQRYGLQPDQLTPLVIVDGYDECGMEQTQPGNLAAHLGLPQGARMIVSCRPDTVPEAQWQARFGFAGQLQVCHHLPFTSTQMLAYLQQHLEWDDATHAAYQSRLQGTQELSTVLSNPFVLHLLRLSWGTVSRKPLEQLTRSAIYAGFIEHMINSGRGLLADGVKLHLQAGHANLGASFEAFARQLAFLACQDRGMTLAVAAAQGTQSAWIQLPGLVQQEARQRFAAREEQHAGLTGETEKKDAKRRMVLTESDYVQMQRQAADKLAASLPLRQRGAHYEFVHKSVFEYCTAQQLLRLVNEEAESMTEAALKALLEWIEKTCPEVLMFVQEGMPAVAQKVPAAAIEQTGNLQASRGQCNEALLLNAIGLVWRARGQYGKALEYCRRALAIQEKVLGEQHVDTASSYNNVGWVLDEQGQYAQALGYLQKALAVREKVLGTEHADTATSYTSIGKVLKAQGQHALALDYCHKALAIQEKVLGKEHVDTASFYKNIAGVLVVQGQYAQALDYCRKALAIQEKVLGTEHADTANSYSNIALVLNAQGQNAQALDYGRKALAIREKVLGTEHVATAISYNNIGSMLKDLGQHAQALDYHRKALAIREKVLGTEHVDTASSYNNIGLVLDIQGQHALALDYHRKALAVLEKILGTEHVDTANSYNNIGLVLNNQGQHALALDYYRKALAIQEKVMGPEHVNTYRFYHNIGWTLHFQGQHGQALDYYRKALAILEKVMGPEHSEVENSYNSIATVLKDQGEHAQALDYYRKVLTIRKTVLGTEHADTATSYNNIGTVLDELGQHAQALDYHRKALAIREKVLGTEHVDTAASYNNIGVVLNEQGQHAQALDYCRKALTIREKVLGSEHVDTAISHYNIGALLRAQGLYAQALDHYRKALDIATRNNHPNVALYKEKVELISAKTTSGEGICAVM